MKNLPHQFNQLPKLTHAVAVLIGLIDAGQDIGDDGVVGDALARTGIYTFKNSKGKEIERLLRIEHKKPKSNQGTRTCARDLCRFFSLLKFIEKTGDQKWKVGPLGRSLLALDQVGNQSQKYDIWRQALLDLVLEDATGTSHPYRILLRLVSTKPGLSKAYAGLCLEAKDDSDKEFKRISEIAKRKKPEEAMISIAGPHMARNANKILPPLAEQLGDLINVDQRLFISDQMQDQLGHVSSKNIDMKVVERLVRRPYAPRARKIGAQRQEVGILAPTTRIYDPDRIRGRFNAHEECLDRFSQLFGKDVKLVQATYDLLVIKDQKALLVEAKTIRRDARPQVRAAMGQLFYYEYFDVTPIYPDKQILRLLLTDQEIDKGLQNFLIKNQVGTVWMPDNGGMGGSIEGLAYLRQLGVSANYF